MDGLQFPFPYESPYECQLDFMTALYDALQHGKHAIFESPTGTGKSLSLICGALHWLTTYCQSKSTANADDWVSAFVEKQKSGEQERKRDRRKRLVNSIQKRLKKPESRQRPKKPNTEEYLVDWDFGDNTAKTAEEWDKVLAELAISDDDLADDEDEPAVQILYATRTHSQIRQFIHEFRKTPFSDRCTCVPLSSRKHLCVNDTVRTLPHALINDACLDLIQAGTKKSHCEFLSGPQQIAMAAYALDKASDLEDLQKKGSEIGACAYFGTRRAAQSAQLVVVPYPSLLSEATRDALGIRIKNNVVIFDEAHNLVECINEMNSHMITLEVVRRCLSAFYMYLEKYGSRLKPSSSIQIKRISFIASAIVQHLQHLSESESSRIITVNDYLFELRIDNQNLWELVTWIEGSGFIKKLIGFMDRHVEGEEKVVKKAHDMKPISALMAFKSFFMSLTNADSDGRVVIDGTNKTSRFLLLNPTKLFSKIVQEARCVILAGGTMQPQSFYRQQLFGDLEDVRMFSCGHVVPSSNVLALVLTQGPTRIPFNFSFTNRSRPALLMELGRTLCNLVAVTPAGIVCFFPSYSFEEEVMKFFDQHGFLHRISAKKRVFREPRDAGSVLDTLTGFARAVNDPHKHSGAFLTCAVGGKMSEGINFSDDLARLVIVVGMPYPNPNDAELQERLNYMRQLKRPMTSDQYLETLCMRAVNQSIGRAIRHRDDYASVVLLDERYTRPSIQQLIPAWIRKSSKISTTFGEAYAALTQFYKRSRASQQRPGP